jgi:hypothetical protein
MVKDGVGKVFIVFSHGTRRCLISERLFTREASREHAEVNCDPAVPEVWLMDDSAVPILPVSVGA